MKLLFGGESRNLTEQEVVKVQEALKSGKGSVKLKGMLVFIEK